MTTRPDLAPHILPTHRPVARLALLRLTGAVAAARGAVAQLTDRLHADGDTFAAAEGWQITRTRWGGRTYRHPGFTTARTDGTDGQEQSR